MAVNSDGTRVVYCSEEIVEVWDVHSDTVESGMRDSGFVVSNSIDGARVAFESGGDDSVDVWNVHTQQQLTSPLNGHAEWTQS